MWEFLNQGPKLPRCSYTAVHQVHLFLGYGARAQYADVAEVLKALEPMLRQIEERCGKQVGREQWAWLRCGRVAWNHSTAEIGGRLPC